MTKKDWTRRDFIKSAGAAGLGAALAPNLTASAEPQRGESAMVAASQKVPLRPFGRSGVEVSILSLGGMFDIPNNQLMLQQALRLGVTYWDTANSYGYGGSEEGIGKFFTKYPDARQSVFLVTKSGRKDPDDLSEHLNLSLKRLNTDTIDLFFMHALSSTRPLTDKVRRWAERAKADGKIQLFGFSTHRNMQRCLREAAKMEWIDGIMMTYNYRLMHEPEMQSAVAACHAAGIGLTAMKTQGGGQIESGSDQELALGGRFLERGFTSHQAKLKAVWENPVISSICSQMPNMTILMANTAAALGQTRLSAADQRLLIQYAEHTQAGYCAGCGDICESALAERPPVADVMRYLMYSRSYGDHRRARERFGRLPAEIRHCLANADYAQAEARCPRGLPIGRLMHEALTELA
jgi:aryl-alcohol dehydrogenase-like predicted oxidoreductase